MDKRIADILSAMTLEEKISICNGADFWHTKAAGRFGVNAVTVSDGPHGLRCQKDAGSIENINESEPATCFPTAVTSGAAWDRELMYEEGRAIGEEALSLDVDVVLGPGVNIKRDPRCGRNFEYFSEDPYVAGNMGAAWIKGVQSTGVGTSLKHFAANSQEYRRFNGNSQMDERTLREIYLAAFEMTVKEAQPATVMCAYPALNGVHCSDNKKLLTDILRTDWGFKGLVMTDWGALCDRIKAMEAGCDLSMPGGSDYMEDKVAEAVRSGRLDESEVDKCAARVLRLALISQEIQNKGKPYDTAAHNALSQKIAEGGAVLMKNEDGILPVNEKDVVLIGYMAKTMRYQGSGSSHINPTGLTSLADAMPDVPFAACCKEDGSIDEDGLKEAAEAAKKARVAVVCAGLPDIYESEGFDRDDMRMPEGHIRMIEAVSAANPNTVVVLFAGSAVEMPWFDGVKAVLYMGLPGQAGGAAAAALLTGKANPSGKLTETWPLSADDAPARGTFGKKYTYYSEGIYVGYRYYQKAGVPVRLPFGFGLSYTTFDYSDIHADANGVSAVITNTGDRAGAEVVELYIAAPADGIHRPVRELKGFEKVMLEPGESRMVSFALDSRSFAVWQDGWKVPGGTYRIEIGASSEDIRLCADVDVAGEAVPAPEWQAGSWYEKPVGPARDADFISAYGGPIMQEPEIKKGNFTMEMSPMEMKDKSRVMKKMFDSMVDRMAESFGGKKDYNDPAFKMMIYSGADAPLRAVVLLSNGRMKSNTAEGLIDIANGHPIRGLKKLKKK